MLEPKKAIHLNQYIAGQFEALEAHVIVETPVSLTVNGEFWLTFMCTPVNLEAMAVGFLYNEGLIQSKAEIADVRLCAAGDNVDVWLYHAVEKPEKWRRTTGCTGGVTSVGEDQPLEFHANGSVLSTKEVHALVDQLFNSQDLYRSTGGVHTSILCDGSEFRIVAEDIGRHNTLDKIAGRALLEEATLSQHVILTTGRISSEMLQKSARIGAAIVISRTSPSSLSIARAEEFGITLIGYARRNRFNIYTHPERILLDETVTADNNIPASP